MKRERKRDRGGKRGGEEGKDGRRGRETMGDGEAGGGREELIDGELFLGGGRKG